MPPLLDLNVEFASPASEVAVEELAVRERGTGAADAEGEVASANLEGFEMVYFSVEGGKGGSHIVEASEEEGVVEKEEGRFEVGEELD